MIKRTMKYEEPTGCYAIFSDVEIAPLQYSDLLRYQTDSKISVPLSWVNAKVVESTIPNISIGKCRSEIPMLESHSTRKGKDDQYALISGGWLPPDLAFSDDTIVLLDQCSISKIKGSFSAGRKKTLDQDFIDCFTTSGIRINPLLAVIEGVATRNPTPHEIKMKYQEITQDLQSRLPKAVLLPSGQNVTSGMIGIVQETLKAMDQKQRFVMDLQQKLQPLTGNDARKQRCQAVLKVAEKHQIPINSLLGLAALSLVSILRNGHNPAKKVLKFDKKPFTSKVAYNGLADLRSLEILIHIFVQFPLQQIMFCTEDKNLALFWAGIRATDFTMSTQSSFKLDPVNELLPSITMEEKESYFGPSET